MREQTRWSVTSSGCCGDEGNPVRPTSGRVRPEEAAVFNTPTPSVSWCPPGPPLKRGWGVVVGGGGWWWVVVDGGGWGDRVAGHRRRDGLPQAGQARREVPRHADGVCPRAVADDAAADCMLNSDFRTKSSQRQDEVKTQSSRSAVKMEFDEAASGGLACRFARAVSDQAASQCRIPSKDLKMELAQRQDGVKMDSMKSR